MRSRTVEDWGLIRLRRTRARIAGSGVLVAGKAGSHSQLTARAGKKRLVTAQYPRESRKTFEKPTFRSLSAVDERIGEYALIQIFWFEGWMFLE